MYVHICVFVHMCVYAHLSDNIKKILIALVIMCVCLHVQHNYAHYFLISGLIFTYSSPSLPPSTTICLAFYLSVHHARACAAACVSRALCLLVVIVVVGSACQ